MTGERCVWILPAELRARIRTYQDRVGIASEVEAARRLLNIALLADDSAVDIVARLGDRYDTLQDIRAVAGEVLATHPAVVSISFKDGGVDFVMKDGVAATFAPDALAAQRARTE